MSVQAEELRRFVADRPPESWREASTRTIVVGSGKGGSGASTVAALLGLGVAEAGRRTLLVDGDDAIGALHHLFGIPSASDALLRQDDPDGEIIWVTNRLALLPGGSVRHRVEAVRTTAVQRSAFYRRIMPMAVTFDVLIVDAGSRLDSVVAATSTHAARYIAVSGIEPAALAASYALVKALEQRIPAARVELLVNGHDDRSGRVAFEHVATATAQFLGRDLAYAGTIPACHRLREAVLSGHALDQVDRTASATAAARILARRLLHDLDRDAATPSDTRRHLRRA